MINQTLNPYTKQIIKTFDSYSQEQVENIVAASADAFSSWRDKTIAERKKLLKKILETLEQTKEYHARLISLEMGKAFSAAVHEIEKSIQMGWYFIDNCEGFLAEKDMSAELGIPARISFEPLGIIFGIMPWNFPYSQVLRAAIPIILAGNTFVLKHAANVPQCALALEQLFHEADFPKDVFRTLLISKEQVESLINLPAIQGVCFTGSVATGSVIAAYAGRALKKSVMELGGSDPFIVLKDADIEKAAFIAADARCRNAGQACISPKRFIIEAPIYNEFLVEFTKNLHSYRFGDPFSSTTQIGPLSSERMHTIALEQLEACRAAGATVTACGEVPSTGFFLAPHVVTNLDPHSAIAQEEFFSPVALVFSVDSAEDAVKLANDTNYGLAASVWTKDIKKAEKIAREIQSGAVAINSPARSNPALPFGGIKNSGYGRELGSYGFLEFVNLKSIYF